jgi:hypothetical protein
LQLEGRIFCGDLPWVLNGVSAGLDAGPAPSEEFNPIVRVWPEFGAGIPFFTMIDNFSGARGRTSYLLMSSSGLRLSEE